MAYQIRHVLAIVSYERPFCNTQLRYRVSRLGIVAKA